MITCDCSIRLNDYESPVVHRVECRRARGDHWCCECSRPIQVGERHEVVTGRWDGAWSTYRTCRTCIAIRRDYCPGGSEYGGLRRHLFDCLGVDYVTGEVDLWSDD